MKTTTVTTNAQKGLSKLKKKKKKKRSTAKQNNNPLIKTSTTLKSDISLALVIKNG